MLTWPLRLCLLRVLLCVSRCYKLSPFQAHWGRWHCTSFLRPVCLITVHMGSGSSPLSCGVFLPPPLSQAFLLLVAGRTLPLLPEPLPPGPAYLFTVPGRIPLPHSWELRAPHRLCHMSLLFLLLITQFLFFPQVGVGLLRGLCWFGPGLSAEYHVTLSSPCPHLPKLSGHRRLVAQGSSWFLCLTWRGDALCRLEVWRGKSFASSPRLILLDLTFSLVPGPLLLLASVALKYVL
jgi:hypothetical protein